MALSKFHSRPDIGQSMLCPVWDSAWKILEQANNGEIVAECRSAQLHTKTLAVKRKYTPFTDNSLATRALNAVHVAESLRSPGPSSKYFEIPSQSILISLPQNHVRLSSARSTILLPLQDERDSRTNQRKFSQLGLTYLSQNAGSPWMESKEKNRERRDRTPSRSWHIITPKRKCTAERMQDESLCSLFLCPQKRGIWGLVRAAATIIVLINTGTALITYGEGSRFVWDLTILISAVSKKK
jgi:hypothetical protein